jgi:hypothetical protein
MPSIFLTTPLAFGDAAGPVAPVLAADAVAMRVMRAYSRQSIQPQAGKPFFFEKKKQKTFVRTVVAFLRARAIR